MKRQAQDRSKHAKLVRMKMKEAAGGYNEKQGIVAGGLRGRASSAAARAGAGAAPLQPLEKGHPKRDPQPLKHFVQAIV